MVNYGNESNDGMTASALMDRVRMLEQRGKYLLESAANRPFPEFSTIRRAVSSTSLLVERSGIKNESAITNSIELPRTEDKRPPPTSYMSPLPAFPLSTARRLFRSSMALNPPLEKISSPKITVDPAPTQVTLPPPDALWSLQQELSQLALQRDEERAKLMSALTQMRSSAEQAHAEFERRLIEKEEALSRVEHNYEQDNKKISQLEEELIMAHDALTSQERELDRVRSELAIHNNAANQLRILLNEVSEKLHLSHTEIGDGSSMLAIPPLPPPSCQSVMVLTHSVSACIRAAWDQAASARTYCDRLTAEITSIKIDCARTIEKMESDRARAIAAIQAEAEHALKLGQQRLSAAQDRLRAVEDQLGLTRDEMTKQLMQKDALLETMRNELQEIRENGEQEHTEAIGRATDAERLLGESEANRLRAAALAADADARSRELELELDEMKRRYAQLEGELAGEHERLCRIWQADGDRSSRIRESESREGLLRRRVAELEEDLQSNITDFQKTLADLNVKNEHCTAELRTSQERVIQLSKELEKTMECLSSYKSDFERVNRAAAESTKYREDAKDMVKMLEDSAARCISLEKSKEHLEEELEGCHKEMDQLRKDSIAARLAAADSVKAAQVLAKRHRDLENQAKEENTRLREEVDKLLQNLGEQEARFAAISAEKKQLEAATGCHPTEQLTAMRALAKKLANAERQLVLLGRTSSVGGLTSRSELDTYVSKLKHSEVKLRDALAELNESNFQKKDADKRASEATQIAQKLKEKLDAEKSRVAFLHQEAAKFHTEAKNYRTQLDAAGVYINRLEGELVRRAKAGFSMKEFPFHNAKTAKEKTLFSVLADKDEASLPVEKRERDLRNGRRRKGSGRRRDRFSQDKFVVLSPKATSPIFFASDKMIVPTAFKAGSQISVSTST